MMHHRGFEVCLPGARSVIPRARNAQRASGFTIMELIAALAILAIVMVIVAQIGYFSMTERLRSSTRQVALEQASNILESARATPWDKLTAEWAAARKLPEEKGFFLPDGRLSVRVEPEKSPANAKRVTVLVEWQVQEGIPQQVRLVGLVSDRAMAVTGGKP
jgi:prepilin-type N-terminal cleavage/methylation domain-containing protein